MIDMLIKATILLAVAGVAAHLLRRRSAELRHWLWALAIVGLIALPVLAVTVPFRLPILPAPQTAVPQTQHDGAPAKRVPPAERVATFTAVSPESAPQEPSPTSVIGDVMSRRPLLRIDQRGAILLTWMLGVTILLARFVAGVVTVRGIVRRAVVIDDESWVAIVDRARTALNLSMPIDLRRSDEVVMPFAAGFVRPVVVLPSESVEWSHDRRTAVITHEMAHISRGDLAMNMVSHVVSALYWFHPLAWLAAHRLRVEGERSCDDAVLRAGARPSDYAEHLLNIVRTAGSTVPTVALAMARRSDFEGRLIAILEPGVPRGRLSRQRAMAMAGLFLAVVMPLALVAPAAARGAPVFRQSESPKTETVQGTEQSAATITALIETLRDSSPVVRSAAIGSLGSLGDPRAIAALAKALREDTDARVREAAARALGEIDDNRAVAPLLEALKVERVANVRVKIIEALSEIDDTSAAQSVSAALRDANALVRRAAVNAVGELNDPSVVPALLTMLRDSDTEVRRNVAQALGQLEDASAIDGLIGMTRDADAEVRGKALESLSQFEDQRALPAFLAALKDSDPDARQHAADAIGNLHDFVKAAPRPLIEALGDQNRDVRHSAAHALGHIGDDAAVPALKRLTSDTDTEVRQAAAEALSEIGGVEALQALMALLKDSDPEVRKIAAEALGKKRR
jgi:HEAT repeat protein/beta-lactamase regulating signal transducer with metallopeptidase domain